MSKMNKATQERVAFLINEEDMTKKQAIDFLKNHASSYSIEFIDNRIKDICPSECCWMEYLDEMLIFKNPKNRIDYLIRFEKLTKGESIDFIKNHASKYALSFIDSQINSHIMYDGPEDWYDYNSEMREFRNRLRTITKWAKRFHSYYFKNVIKKELIAKALHPSRIGKQLSQFDNIEDFFEACGY